MNRKHVAVGFLFFILFLTVLMVLNIAQKQTSKRIDFEQLPNLSLYDLENNEYNIYEKTQNQYVLLVFVQSDCDYCHQEIKQLSDSIGFTKDLKVLLISSESITQLEFLNKVITNENIILLSDNNKSFSNVFKVSSYPSLFLFDKDKKILKRYKGSEPMSTIFAEIQ